MSGGGVVGHRDEFVQIIVHRYLLKSAGQGGSTFHFLFWYGSLLVRYKSLLSRREFTGEAAQAQRVF